VQQNAAMYSNAHVWMQTFDCCCTAMGQNLDKAPWHLATIES